MKFAGILFFIWCFAVFSVRAQRPQADKIETSNGALTVQPVNHGTLVLSWNGHEVYVDPTGGAKSFEGIDSPAMILITHTHGDHMDIETLKALNTEKAIILAPQSVADELPGGYNDRLVILDNEKTAEHLGITVRAVPMYNLPESPDSRHPKGWGNGYVLTFGGSKVYVSGDTEDIPEMRALRNIDVAFVCMNLPYTMDIEQAASAVLDFKPKIIYPYHYRGQDTEKFKALVSAENKQIDVRLRNWYPED